MDISIMQPSLQRRSILKNKFLRTADFPERARPGKKKLKVGQRIEPSYLSDLALKTYKRLSQIWGVPIRKLLPILQSPNFLNKDERSAGFDPQTHTVAFGKKVRYPRVLEHESLHAVQSFFHKNIETKYAQDESFRHFIEKTVHMPELFEFVQQHGSDGLIYLYARPPKELSRSEMIRWEQEAIKKGHLFPQGGFTRKGLQYIRKIVPRETVFRQITKAEKELQNRKKVA